MVYSPFTYAQPALAHVATLTQSLYFFNISSINVLISLMEKLVTALLVLSATIWTKIINHLCSFLYKTMTCCSNSNLLYMLDNGRFRQLSKASWKEVSNPHGIPLGKIRKQILFHNFLNDRQSNTNHFALW